jgi:hypothetical protein
MCVKSPLSIGQWNFIIVSISIILVWFGLVWVVCCVRFSDGPLDRALPCGFE